VENCRLEGLYPEAYLIELIARMPDYPMKSIAKSLPRAWKNARSLAAAASVAIPIAFLA
jgi:hypothetical protein